MYSFTVSVSALKAARTHAAVKDVRYYLLGVLFDTTAGRIVATDGHRAFICAGPRVDDGPRFIVPSALLDAALKACKGRNAPDTLTVNFAPASTPECARAGTLELVAGAARFAGNEVDGVFPDYQRITPRKVTGETAQYNPQYLADAVDALRIHADSPKLTPRIEYNGQSPCIVHANGACAAFVLVMPWRVESGMDADMAAFIGIESDAPVAAAA
jgi:DNA polymerase III subunit beta